MSWGTGPVLSSVLACLSPLGARARSQVNKMWQETMNQGDEGIKEVRLTPGSKSLFFLLLGLLQPVPAWQGPEAAPSSAFRIAPGAG